MGWKPGPGGRKPRGLGRGTHLDRKNFREPSLGARFRAGAFCGLNRKKRQSKQVRGSSRFDQTGPGGTPAAGQGRSSAILFRGDRAREGFGRGFFFFWGGGKLVPRSESGTSGRASPSGTPGLIYFRNFGRPEWGLPKKKTMVPTNYPKRKKGRRWWGCGCWGTGLPKKGPPPSCPGRESPGHIRGK